MEATALVFVLHDQMLDSPKKPAHSDRGATVAANVVTSYLRYGVSLISMLLLTPFVISRIGEDDYGLWALVLCCVGYLELLEFGLGTALIKFTGQLKQGDAGEHRNRLASTFFVVYLAIAAVCLVVGVGLFFVFDELFSIPAGQQSKASWLLLLLTARLCLNLPLGLFFSMLFGNQHISVVNGVKAACTAGYALSVWWTLQAGYGVVAQAMLNSGWLVLEHLLYVAACRVYFPGMRIRIQAFDARLFRRVASFSGFALLVNVGSIITLRTDLIVVSLHLPLAAVAIYALAMKVAEQVMLLAKQMINVFTPLFAELHGAGARKEIRHVFLWYSKIALAVTVGAVVPLSIYSTCAVTLWVGDAYRQAGPILTVLAITVLVRIMQAAATNVLAMTGHHRSIALVVMMNAIANVGLSLALAPVWGLFGVAMATLTSTLAAGVLLIGKTCFENNVSFRQYLASTTAPLLVPAATYALICAAWANLSPPATLPELILEVGCFGLAYTLLVWKQTLTPVEREFARQRLPLRLQQVLATSWPGFQSRLS